MTKFATAVAVLLLSFAASDARAAADLRITPWTDGERYAFTVYNFGPDQVAHDVTLYVDIPDGLSIRWIYDEHHRCDVNVRPIRCFTPALSQLGDALAFDAAFDYRPADATYTITARVESAADPDPSNNTSSHTFTTRLYTNFSEWVEPSNARVDPGATHQFVTELHNYTDTYPSDVRIRYTATNATIEKIEPADPRWHCSVSGATGECVADSLDADCRCSKKINVTLRASADRNGGVATLEMDATSSIPDEYPLVGTGTVQTYRVLAVTNTADAGPGSLREAMTQAGASCSPGPCKIVFEIAEPVPAEGWFTIVPSTELPQIVAERVAIDGTSQTRFSGDTNTRGPEVAIDGRLALRGLSLRGSCEAIVEGLAIGNFIGGDGLYVSTGSTICSSFDAPDRHLVAGNYIGVDPTGTAAWPNQRGLNVEGLAHVRDNVISRNKWSGVWFWRGYGTFFRNTIEDNGKTGIVLGPLTEHARVMENKINRQAEMGVAVAPGALLYEIRGNSMSANGGLGIDIGVDGVSPSDGDDEFPRASNAPVLLSAVYDAARDRTVVTMLLRSRRLGPYGASTILDFYANAAPDGDGEQHVYYTYAYGPAEGQPFQVELWGNYTGRWINATATRTHSAWAKPPDDKGVRSLDYTGEGHSTSELSNAVLVN